MSEKIFSVLVAEPMAKEGLLILENSPRIELSFKPEISRNELQNSLHKYHALLVRSQTKVDQELIDSGKSLRLIGRAGVGLNNIDREYAKSLGIEVINTPTGNSLSTAEFTFALMLASARKIPMAQNSLQSGEWKRAEFSGFELSQKTLGLIGFGNVAKILSERANAFGMRVISYDPLVERSIFGEYGVEKLSLNEIFEQAHILSLHCSLNEHTKNLINHETLALMKKHSVIINTARGELIDSRALADALDQNHIAFAALDVFEKEPPTKSNPLINHPKVIVTPHLGASTKEAQIRVSTLLAEQTIGYFSRETLV